MTHSNLIQWGRHAFNQGLSLSHIEAYLVKRGLKRSEALNALHEITSFEHKLKKETEKLGKVVLAIFAFILLLISASALLYFAGILK